MIKNQETGNNKAAHLLEDLLEQVGSSQEAYVKALGAFTGAAFRRYSFGNRLLIWSQRPEATRVAGYRDWQARGRQVKKGETGIAILAPLTRKLEGKDGDPDEVRLVGFRTVYVFDVAQTQGDPLTDPIKAGTVAGSVPFQAILEACPFPVVLEQEDGGWGSWDGSRIRVSPNLAPENQATVIVHEWAHALLHDPAVVNRSAEKARFAELEAESVAYVVCQALGYQYPGALAYLGMHKATRADLEVILGTVAKVSGVILEALGA
jgi:antirestriction protein ArdC